MKVAVQYICLEIVDENIDNGYKRFFCCGKLSHSSCTISSIAKCPFCRSRILNNLHDYIPRLLEHISSNNSNSGWAHFCLTQLVATLSESDIDRHLKLSANLGHVRAIVCYAARLVEKEKYMEAYPLLQCYNRMGNYNKAKTRANLGAYHLRYSKDFAKAETFLEESFQLLPIHEVAFNLALNIYADDGIHPNSERYLHLMHYAARQIEIAQVYMMGFVDVFPAIYIYHRAISCGPKLMKEDFIKPAYLALKSSCWNCRCNHVVLKKCNGCKLVWYCSKTCQNINWNYHKHHCKYFEDGLPRGWNEKYLSSPHFLANEHDSEMRCSH
jgi:hypothetical protein